MRGGAGGLSCLHLFFLFASFWAPNFDFLRAQTFPNMKLRLGLEPYEESAGAKEPAAVTQAPVVCR